MEGKVAIAMMEATKQSESEFRGIAKEGFDPNKVKGISLFIQFGGIEEDTTHFFNVAPGEALKFYEEYSDMFMHSRVLPRTTCTHFSKLLI